MISVALWLLTSIITCVIVGAFGALTGTLAASIFIIWGILYAGGWLFIDGDFDLFN